VALRSKKWGSLAGMLIAAAGVGIFLAVRINKIHAAGGQVFWLAELWAPSAFLSIVLVTFVEKLVRTVKKRWFLREVA
jgi:hypothetical protein